MVNSNEKQWYVNKKKDEDNWMMLFFKYIIDQIKQMEVIEDG